MKRREKKSRPGRSRADLAEEEGSRVKQRRPVRSEDKGAAEKTREKSRPGRRREDQGAAEKTRRGGVAACRPDAECC